MKVKELYFNTFLPDRIRNISELDTFITALQNFRNEAVAYNISDENPININENYDGFWYYIPLTELEKIKQKEEETNSAYQIYIKLKKKFEP